METTSPAEHDHLICELQERIKELDCLYVISHIAANPHATFDSILHDITDRIPSGFQKPESTCARVAIGSNVTQTANFKTCQWKLEVDIAGDEKAAGRLEVGYLGVPPHGGFVFLREEEKLVQDIAFRIGQFVQRKSLIDSLTWSEREFRNLVEYAPVGIFRSNLRGDLLYLNHAALHMFGYETLDEAKAANPLINRYRNPEDRYSLLEILRETGKVSNVEVEYATKTGESIFILLSAMLESDVLTGMMMDVTERKRANERLIESEARLIEAQRIANLGSWGWDILGGTLHWSDEACRIFGLRTPEFAGTYDAFVERIHPEDREAVRAAVNHALSHPDTAYSIEHRVVRPDGEERVVHERGEVTFDVTDRP